MLGLQFQCARSEYWAEPQRQVPGEKRGRNPGGRSRPEPAPSATSPGTPPSYSWTTLRLRLGLRPPNHPMSAGEPLDTSLGIDVFIRFTPVVRSLATPQQAEFHPRPAPQECSLCPKFACWSQRLWPCFFRSPCWGDGFQTLRGTFLSLSVAPTPTPCLGSVPRMRGAGFAPQLLRRGRRLAQHVAHVLVPLPTPSAPLPPRRDSV